MADALLSALAGTILTSLNSLVAGEFSTISGLRTELNNLKSTFTTIKAVIHDAEEKQWKDKAVKDWLRKLKDAAYEVEDVLDDFAIYAQRPRNPKSRVRSFFSLSEVKMAHKLKSVREKLDVIATEKKKFHLRAEEVIRDDKEQGVLDWRLTSSLPNEQVILGRNKEKEELMRMVLSNTEDLAIHAICGMGGLGKTTLAQLVYNDEDIQKYFELRIWVCVSDDNDLRRLIRAIIESVEGSPPNNQELDPLQKRLQKNLGGRKFLLVLDDVWNDIRHNWNALHNTIRCGATGSAVIVTTRDKNIARILAAVSMYSIESLSDDYSWSLFQQWAFGLGEKEMFGHLEGIGRNIVKKCGGVPLAIKSMGTLLRFKRTEREWRSVLESEIWDSSDEGKMILSSLRLSYTHLEPHVRQCFAFCSVYPKDYAMNKDDLIGLWMAHDFIACKEQTDLYDKGQEVFGELVCRSFLQDVEEDLSGNTTCKMHDLVHDLAQSIMMDEYHLIEPNKLLEVLKMVRHLAVYNSSYEYFPLSSNLFKDKSLRSLFWFGYRWEPPSPSNLSRQKHLRVLSLTQCSLDKMPMSIDKLKHLRYLNFSKSKIRSLPESTTSLQNLQMLKLRNCSGLYTLPKGLKHMKNLIHLDNANCNEVRSMPAGMGQLTGLRKLSMFIVGEDNGQGIGELKEMNLGGELSIRNLEYIESCRDAKNANLVQKKDLKSLTLSWSKGNHSSVSEEVLDGLQPNSNLKKLRIEEYGGSNFPNWMMELSVVVPNLAEIELASCSRCQHLPAFGELKFLKVLRLKAMCRVKKFIENNGESRTNLFPSLESLSLELMSDLEEWVIGRDHFPALGSLIVRDCYTLLELPILPSVKTLEIWNGSEELMRSIMNFKFLMGLKILGCRNLRHLPDGMLQSCALLKELEVWYFEKLESFPDGLWSLNSLEKIVILRCGIKSFPPPSKEFHGLSSSLRQLRIVSCEEFTHLSEGVRHLTALEGLALLECPKLNSLPESIGHLTALRNLEISCSHELCLLPNEIGNLMSLSKLEIRYCPNVKYLPEGMRNLKMLREVKIIDCPNLKGRCEEDKGEDWPKIAHIPIITIPT